MAQFQIISRFCGVFFTNNNPPFSWDAFSAVEQNVDRREHEASKGIRRAAIDRKTSITSGDCDVGKTTPGINPLAQRLS